MGMFDPFAYRSGPMPEIIAIDLARAELLIAQFRTAYPTLAAMAEQFKVTPTEVAPVFLPLEPSRIEPTGRGKRQTTRHSTKTGATWPKPKGSY